MAPEQVRGHALDGRTDLFSFGVMLYEMTTGEKPFAGTNVTTIIYKIIHENPVPPRELDVTIHPGLDKVIMKALAKKPEERYQTGAELARELQSYKSLGADTESTQEIPSGAYPAPSGAAPAPAPVKSAPKVAAAKAGAGPSAAKPRKMQPPPPSKKLWIGVGVFVALVAAASWGVWRGTVSKDHPLVAPTTAVSTPHADTTPAPSPENPAITNPAVKPVAEKAVAGKKGVAAPVTAKKTFVTTSGDKPSTTTSGTGDLKLFSNPDGAAIEIDGHGDPSMKTPYFALRMAPGPHEITFIKSGYVDEKRVVDVAKGKTAFVGATLTRAQVATSEVTFNSDPGGAEILVDGKSIGKVTPSQAVIVAGAHQFVLRKPGYEDATISANLVPGQPLAVSNMLKSLAPASSGSAFGKFKKIFSGNAAEENVSVGIKSTPPGAAISLNGKDLGQQTPFTLPLAPGKYDIGLALAGHQTVRKSIKVEKGKPIEIDEALPAQ
jgi:hypothetical protein